MQKRNTEQKKAIFSELRERYDHPSATQLFEVLKERYPKLSRATVYRVLKDAADEGEILRLHVGSEDRFDGRDGHCHVICTECGEIYDAPFPESVTDHLARESGYEISFRNAEFFGICPNCKKKAP